MIEVLTGTELFADSVEVSEFTVGLADEGRCVKMNYRIIEDKE
jgi:hypothetical protein